MFKSYQQNRTMPAFLLYVSQAEVKVHLYIYNLIFFWNPKYTTAKFTMGNESLLW